MPRDLLLFAPEALLLVGALFVFVLLVVQGDKALRGFHGGWWLTLLFALGAFGASLATLNTSGEPFFPGIYRVDFFSQLVKAGLSGVLVLVVLLSRQTETVRPSARPEALLFLLFGTCAMALLVSATELLTLYVALEFSAYTLYILVALHRRPQLAGEAGAKYVLFGAASSAVSLYGVTLMFGTAGTTYLAPMLQSAAAGSPLFIIGLLLLLGGLFFKLAVFPFHFWAPDAYQGAPHQLATYVGTVSKIAAAAVLCRLVTLSWGRSGRPELLLEVLTILAVASMTIGNLAALMQRDLKRLLGYSTVAHAGYLLIGFCASTETGIAAVVFYALTYAVIATAAFAVVCALGRDGENPTLETLAGLYQRSPGLALLLLVAMFGLAGIPPTAGFTGKWFIFGAALQRGQFELVVVAALNSTIALYYYLRVVKEAYLTPPAHGPLAVSLSDQVVGWIAALLVLVAGIAPGPLWLVCQRAAYLLLPG